MQPGAQGVPMKSDSCELCQGDGGELLYRGPRYRVVRVTGAEGESYPGFCRVIWNDHVKEMSDLSDAERQQFMAAVFTVEAALRTSMRPEKMNLASLGNMTPHLHWHVIPRFSSDPTYPKPIWATAIAPPPQIDKLVPEQGIRSTDAHVEWVSAVRNALDNIG